MASEEEQDDRADWRSHPHTQRLKQGMLNGIEAAKEELIRASMTSIDPAVRHACGALRAQQFLLETYFPAPRKP